MANTTRRIFHVPDTMYAAMKKAARQLSKERGVPVSVATWLREAIAAHLKAGK